MRGSIGSFTGTTPRLDSWEAAIEAICDLRRVGDDNRPMPVVIDEVGYLLDADPAFASRLQAALVDADWLLVDRGPLRERSSRYSVAEPIVRFHRLVVEPAAVRLTRRGAGRAIWEDAMVWIRPRVFAPHLERLAREWVLLDSSPATSGGVVNACGPSRVGSGDRVLQLDLLATTADHRGRKRVCAVGEVKSGQDRVGAGQLERLDFAIDLLDPKVVDESPKRLLISRSGFTRQLEQTASHRRDVELIDLPRLYSGS